MALCLVGAAAEEAGAGDDEGDFLPLPISEQYQLPKKQRRSAQGVSALPTGNTAADWAGPVQAALHTAGLESSGSEEASRAAVQHSTAATEPKGGQAAQAAADFFAGKPKKKKKNKAVALGPTAGAAPGQPEQQGHAKHKQHSAYSTSETPPVAAGMSPSQPDCEADFIPFDFAAAHAAAAGLNISASPSGRGGRRGGRGDRGRGRGGARGGFGSDRGDQRSLGGATDVRGGGGDKKRKGFNMWAVAEADVIRGGKRSAVMPRSGNRNMTFG